MPTIVPTSAPPVAPSQQVSEAAPSLMQSQEHELCPGCGQLYLGKPAVAAAQFAAAATFLGLIVILHH